MTTALLLGDNSAKCDAQPRCVTSSSLMRNRRISAAAAAAANSGLGGEAAVCSRNPAASYNVKQLPVASAVMLPAGLSRLASSHPVHPTSTPLTRCTSLHKYRTTSIQQFMAGHHHESVLRGSAAVKRLPSVMPCKCFLMHELENVTIAICDALHLEAARRHASRSLLCLQRPYQR